MKLFNNITLGICLVTMSVAAVATPIADYSFKSPSFNGAGYGAFQMAIENQQLQRQQAIQQALEAKAAQLKADANNNPINQFLTNLQSRIYAQISQNLATAMFAGGSATSGQMDFQGNTIFWNNTGTAIQLKVADHLGNITDINVPLGKFNIQGSGTTP
ncbi:Type VIII secretion system, CsgF [uncultured Caudovirales phage]|uniref:Type VIII secretion system, CsgF n=1 Tax=uncultured Caudovirales phage TaxID=2100421 RepID=A0A6J7WHM9_9CAUD|nr:Type VIII secretion system, CsgF [uncultured Caudovirales phage]